MILLSEVHSENASDDIVVILLPNVMIVRLVHDANDFVPTSSTESGKTIVLIFRL